MIRELTPYATALLILSAWLVLALAPQIPILARTSRSVIDWSVVGFRGSLLLLGACVFVSYFFDITRWLIVAAWLVLDVSATFNAVYIVRRAHEENTP